ncbi:conserved Plasmodium protein, unknown function [Plasmodium gallinaceum]|uniref:Uncharacterized protein n=1 Tax=Plasmodium gallinaceum TaxID=5849 RepID=A0A1J1H2B6_PLAGA|nr:conserved Plasmodium protein, unknown function [Plasmodium gallinaceum]CRG97643.1 conserved Plasmodium protein, unknown function [Plasmodium gallinaceum]
MVKKDNIWMLCKLCYKENNEIKNENKEEDIYKILENLNIPLSSFIKEEFDKKAILLFGRIFKSILFSRFYIVFANLKLRIFIIRTSNRYKREVSLLTRFVTICDDIRVKILYSGVTLCKCKRFLKELFIKLKIEDNIPTILKELESCS